MSLLIARRGIVSSRYIADDEPPDLGDFPTISNQWAAWDAHDIGGSSRTITTWDSKESVQLSRQGQYATDGVNGHPGVGFFASGDGLDSPSIAISQPFTILMVWEFSSTGGTGQRVWRSSDSTLWKSGSGTWQLFVGSGANGLIPNNLTPNAAVIVVDGGTAQVTRLDGSGSGSVGSNDFITFRLGQHDTSPTAGNAMNGYIGAFGVWEKAVTVGERDDLLSWAQDHWAL